jgi:inner membrane protein
MKYPLFKKVLVIAVLTSLLMIPLTMIEGVVYERSAYRNQARESIAESWTGEQQLVGPLLVVPYKEHYNLKVWDKAMERFELKEHTRDGRLIIAPEKLMLQGEVDSETRKRGIYEVPVYHSRLGITGEFDLGGIDAFVKGKENRIEWQSAYLSVMIRDLRGVELQPLLKWREETHEFVSDTRLDGMRNGMHASLGQLRPDQTPVAFSFELRLNGMEQLLFSPLGKNTTVELQADWPDPSFIGRYLPSSREIDARGFKANWHLSSFSSSIHQQLDACEKGSCAQLMQESFGVRLFNSVDIYHQSERSVKYALMFIGLTFFSLFLYEVMKGLRMHPMQYLLVGLGLSVFYLLLISLSEHMTFVYAYIIATLASTLLIGFYVGSILRSAKHGGFVTLALLLLYGLLYGILSSEDNSLLMGSLLIFGVLSLVMIVTRRLDWYAVTDDLTVRLSARRNTLHEAPAES